MKRTLQVTRQGKYSGMLVAASGSLARSRHDTTIRRAAIFTAVLTGTYSYLLSMGTTSRRSTSSLLASPVRVHLSTYTITCTKGPPLLTHSPAFIMKLQTDNTASSAEATFDILA
jgi:hypothetical protein